MSWWCLGSYLRLSVHRILLTVWEKSKFFIYLDDIWFSYVITGILHLITDKNLSLTQKDVISFANVIENPIELIDTSGPTFIQFFDLLNHIVRIKFVIKCPGRWLRITVFLGVTSPYTAVYDEIRHENGPYSAVILVTKKWHRIQHRIMCRIRSYACRILITNGRKTPAWITVKIRCVNGPYLTVYGRISAVFFDQGVIINFWRRKKLE